MNPIIFETFASFPFKKELFRSSYYFSIDDLFYKTKRYKDNKAYEALYNASKLDYFNLYFKNCYGISIELNGNPIFMARSARMISNKVMIIQAENLIPQSISILGKCPFKNFGYATLLLLGSCYLYYKMKK